YVSSKLMCWVALDRAAQLAAIRGDAEAEKKWAAVAEEIKEDILSQGVDGRGVLRQHYETDSLDASSLLAAIFGFLPDDDGRRRGSSCRSGWRSIERADVKDGRRRPRSRFGAAGRLALFPARAAARATRGPIENAADEHLVPELSRLAERAFASDLPEELARS